MMKMMMMMIMMMMMMMMMMILHRKTELKVNAFSKITIQLADTDCSLTL